MKTDKFDIAIIGAGPTACFSALSLMDNLKSKKKIILLTGETNDLTYSNAHPNFNKKIHNKEGGFFEKFKIFNTKNNYLFATGLIGGFSNFWGGQLQTYDKKDSFVKNFNSFNDYKFYCKKVYEYVSYFRYIKKKNQNLVSKNFENLSPILIKKHNIFKEIFNELIKKKFLVKNKSRVLKIIKEKNIFKIITKKDSTNIEAKQVIMACGTLSTSKIILNSTSISQSIFYDHYPHYFFCLDIKNTLKNEINKKNFLTIKKKEKQKNIFFASVYDLSNFYLSEISSYFFKKNLKILNKFKLPNIFKLIKPIQLWTPPMLNLYKMNKKNIVKISTNYKKEKDKVYSLFRKNLNKNLILLRESNNYLGFHYHNLNFKLNKKFYDVDKILMSKFGSGIICVDSSSVKDISVIPPTLSLIALSYFKTKKFIND